MRALKQILRQEALKDATLYALIQDRIYPAEMALIEDPGFPCINFKIYGGSIEGRVKEFADIIVDFWAWSRSSFDQALEVYQALFDFLEFTRLANETIAVVFQETTRPVESYDPDLSAWYVMGRWSARYIM